MALPSVDKPFELVSALPATAANRLVDYSDYQVLRPKRICPVLDARGIFHRMHSDEVAGGRRDRDVAGNP